VAGSGVDGCTPLLSEPERVLEVTDPESEKVRMTLVVVTPSREVVVLGSMSAPIISS
jgi:hypothetical protein